MYDSKEDDKFCVKLMEEVEPFCGLTDYKTAAGREQHMIFMLRAM